MFLLPITSLLGTSFCAVISSSPACFFPRRTSFLSCSSFQLGSDSVHGSASRLPLWYPPPRAHPRPLERQTSETSAASCSVCVHCTTNTPFIRHIGILMLPQPEPPLCFLHGRSHLPTPTVVRRPRRTGRCTSCLPRTNFNFAPPSARMARPFASASLTGFFDVHLSKPLLRSHTLLASCINSTEFTPTASPSAAKSTVRNDSFRLPSRSAHSGPFAAARLSHALFYLL